MDISMGSSGVYTSTNYGSNSELEDDHHSLLGPRSIDHIDIVLLANTIVATSPAFMNVTGLHHNVFCGEELFIENGATFSVKKHPIGYVENPSGFVAIKSPLLRNTPTESAAIDRQKMLNSVYIELRTLSHPVSRNQENIVRLLGITWEADLHDSQKMWPSLILEFAEYGTLKDLLHLYHCESKFLPVQTKLELCADVARGLDVLHDLGIVHGDVKIENILIFKGQERDYVAKIADFGSAVYELSVKKQR
jgi:serine/threonine protein kinase